MPALVVMWSTVGFAKSQTHQYLSTQLKAIASEKVTDPVSILADTPYIEASECPLMVFLDS